MDIKLTVNDRDVEWKVRADETLAEALRNHGFSSIKVGCDQGACGSCTVWVDEKPLLSCSLLAVRLQGKSITTVEGIQDEAAAFGEYAVAEGADQCGFCSPGRVMLVVALKKELEVGGKIGNIRDVLKGNLCRCSGYQGWLRAASNYLEVEIEDIS